MVTPVNATQEQLKATEERNIKYLKAKNYLFQAIDRPILETILVRNTSKDIWDAMHQKYHGLPKAKRAHLQSLCIEF